MALSSRWRLASRRHHRGKQPAAPGLQWRTRIRADGFHIAGIGKHGPQYAYFGKGRKRDFPEYLNRTRHQPIRDGIVLPRIQRNFFVFGRKSSHILVLSRNIFRQLFPWQLLRQFFVP